MEGTFQYAWIALVGGAASFAHCLGMCGPFALHLSGGAETAGSGAGGAGAASGATRADIFLRQLLWHVGRIFSYVFLGALAGFFGRTIVSLGPWPWVARGLSLAMGAVMIAAGLKMLGVFPVRSRKGKPTGATGSLPVTGSRSATESPSGFLTGVFSSLLSPLLGRPTSGGAFALGLATGFLPCPVVVIFLALAVQSQSAPVGMATMAAMGVGTVWSLGLLGAAGGALRSRLRKWGPALGGGVLVLLGAATALRASDAFHAILGCQRCATSGAGEGAAGGGCCRCGSDSPTGVSAPHCEAASGSGETRPSPFPATPNVDGPHSSAASDGDGPESCDLPRDGATKP
jgi:hypothetical protein